MLDGKHPTWDRDFLWSPYSRCCVEFKSGLWLDPSRAVRALCWWHSSIILAVCFISTNASVFGCVQVSNTGLCLFICIHPQSCLPATEEPPWQYAASPMLLCRLGNGQVMSSAHIVFGVLPSPGFVSSDQMLIFLMFWVSFKCRRPLFLQWRLYSCSAVKAWLMQHCRAGFRSFEQVLPSLQRIF